MKLKERGIDVLIVGPTEQQTKKAIALHVSTAKHEGSFICWESGECDTMVADLIADQRLPVNDCVISSHYEFSSTTEVAPALQEFFRRIT